MEAAVVVVVMMVVVAAAPAVHTCNCWSAVVYSQLWQCCYWSMLVGEREDLKDT